MHVAVRIILCGHSNYIALFCFLSLFSGGSQGNGWNVVRESNQARLQAQWNHPRPEESPTTLMQQHLELTKNQLAHLGLPLFSLERSFLLNAKFVCCTDFSFLLKPHTVPRGNQDTLTRSLWHSLQIRSMEVHHIIAVFLWQCTPPTASEPALFSAPS